MLLSFAIMNLLYAHFRIGSLFHVDFNTPFIARTIISACFDVVCMAAVLYFVSGKKRHFAYAFVYILSLVWAMSNIMVATYLNSYGTLSLMKEVGGIKDLHISHYFLNAFHVSDAWLLISTILFLVLWKYTYKTPVCEREDSIFYVSVPAIFVIFFISLKLFVYEGNVVFPNRYTFKQVSLIPSKDRLALCPDVAIPECGIIRGIILPALFEDNVAVKLSPKEKDEISRYRLHSERSVSLPMELGFTKQYDRIIFIIAETYLPFSSRLTFNGKEVTPFLSALRKSKNVCFNDSVLSNSGIGTSSDGQFIYITGLLPLKDRLTVSVIQNRTLKTLPDMLRQSGFSTIMTIPTHNYLWSQNRVSPVYGFDKLYSLQDSPYAKAVGNKNGWLDDQQLFSFAERNEMQHKGPLFHVILTSSTHSPYNVTDEPLGHCGCCPVFPASYNTELRNYLRECHFMDHSINNYIDNMKRKGLYDKSLIVIASDHGWREDNTILPEGVNPETISFLILNLPHITTHCHMKVNQVDLFTSLVDFLHQNHTIPHTDWYGLGQSIFRSNDTKTLGREWIISSNIILGDYFKNNK